MFVFRSMSQFKASSFLHLHFHLNVMDPAGNYLQPLFKDASFQALNCKQPWPHIRKAKKVWVPSVETSVGERRYTTYPARGAAGAGKGAPAAAGIQLLTQYRLQEQETGSTSLTEGTYQPWHILHTDCKPNKFHSLCCPTLWHFSSLWNQSNEKSIYKVFSPLSSPQG